MILAEIFLYENLTKYGNCPPASKLTSKLVRNMKFYWRGLTLILLLRVHVPLFTGTKDYPDVNVDEEDDFDQFLASVKAKQASITGKGGANHGSKLHSITSDDEEDVEEDEEVDFGYWEKATPLPSSDSLSTDKLPDARARTEGLIKDIDLNLL